MKIKLFFTLFILLILTSQSVTALETRIYRQIKDVSLAQSGKVQTSRHKGDLFELTLEIDRQNKIVRRTAIKRLDKPHSRKTAKVYDIKKNKQLFGSSAGEGGKTIIAVSRSGNEIIQIGEEFCFTARTGPFSQIISGTYERI